jgi:hypothetical protein
MSNTNRSFGVVLLATLITVTAGCASDEGFRTTGADRPVDDDATISTSAERGDTTAELVAQRHESQN